MKYDWKNDLALFLIVATMFTVAFLCQGCSYVPQSQYDRVHAVAMSALKRNVKLLMTNDSLLTELERCQNSKLFRTELK